MANLVTQIINFLTSNFLILKKSGINIFVSLFLKYATEINNGITMLRIFIIVINSVKII